MNNPLFSNYISFNTPENLRTKPYHATHCSLRPSVPQPIYLSNNARISCGNAEGGV